MPKINPMKIEKRKLITVKGFEEGIESDESKDTPFKNIDGHCAGVGEDAEEDLNVLITNSVKSTAPMKRKNDIEADHFIDTAMKSLNDSMKKQEMDRVEGLLNRGALKPDDRPIWYDVYRAFPPLVEPKYARPKPTKEPIKQIFYPEDQQRASFHALGHGLGAVNMLSPTGDTHIKKLLRSYEEFKSDGIPEEKLIEQCVATVEGDRRQAAIKVTALNPQSVTSQVMAEADIKNIFKEH